MKTTLLTTSPQGVKGSLFSEMAAFTKSHTPEKGRLGFAFVTRLGVKELVTKLESQEWDGVYKDFLVGIGNGITEPHALEMLRQVANSRVRVFIPTAKLSKSTLTSKELFHPKTVLLENPSSKNYFLYCGSHNLTGAALGECPSNHEVGIATFLQNNADDRSCIQQFDQWWGSFSSRCRVVDRKFINAYSKMRSRQFIENPYLAGSISLASNVDQIDEANELWIEVGKASGVDRHQVEFPRELAKFFMSPEERRVDFNFVSNGNRWSDKPFSWKKTSYNVDIWRLSMPTINVGGERIQGRFIKFRRTEDPITFEYEVADADSRDLKIWSDLSSKNGTLGTTSGRSGRRYGFN